MIKPFLLIAFITLGFSFSINKHKAFVPPGTVKINDTLYADACEITNLSWQEYESWTITKYGKNSREHVACLPDTSVWRDSTACNEPYAKYYYRHPAYHDYPVVGISYEQALAFCKWRTQQVKQYMAIAKMKDSHFEYRLPNKEEWEFISTNGDNIFYNNGKNNKNGYLLNCRCEEAGEYVDVTSPAKSFSKNRLGLYNCFGNVAEMISEKGICKGGSWRHQLDNCRAGKNTAYAKPAAWLGFRCVCVVNS